MVSWLFCMTLPKVSAMIESSKLSMIIRLKTVARKNTNQPKA